MRHQGLRNRHVSDSMQAIANRIGYLLAMHRSLIFSLPRECGAMAQLQRSSFQRLQTNAAFINLEHLPCLRYSSDF